VQPSTHVEEQAERARHDAQLAALQAQIDALQSQLDAAAAARPKPCCAKAKTAGVYTIVNGERELCKECFEACGDVVLAVHVDGARRTSGALRPGAGATVSAARQALRDLSLEVLDIVDDLDAEARRLKPHPQPLNGVQGGRVQVAPATCAANVRAGRCSLPAPVAGAAAGPDRGHGRRPARHETLVRKGVSFHRRFME